MSREIRREAKGPLAGTMVSVPVSIRRGGVYVEKIEANGAAFYLLSSHHAYEMSRIDLATLVRFTVKPQAYAQKSLYVLTGKLICLENSAQLRTGSSLTLGGIAEPITLEAQGQVSLLYFSTRPDFSTLADGVKRN